MKAPFAKLITGLGIFSILCALPSVAEAAYAGTKSMGRGSAVMAHPLDALAIAYNPASISWIDEQLNIGGMWIRQDGRTNFKNNLFVDGTYQSHIRESTFLPEIGGSMHYYQWNWTVGFAAYTRNYIKTTYDLTFPTLGTSHLGLEYELEAISPAFSIKFGRYHSLGFSVDLLAQRLMVNGLQGLRDFAFTDHPNKVSNKGYDYSLGIGVTVGWVGEIWPCVRMAFSWSPAVSMQDFKKYKGLLARKGFFHVPQRFMGGLSVEIFDNLIFEIDAEHSGWNRIPALDHSIAKLDTAVPPFGENNGAGLGWRDQLNWRMGFEYIYTECMSMRVGYQHSRSPVRRSQAFFNMLAPHIIEDWITAGLTWKTFRLGELSIYTGYGFEHEVNGTDTSIPAIFGGGSVTLKESQLNIALAWTKYY